MNKTLIIGYGNIDRQDDGAAWYILAGLAKILGRDFFSLNPSDEISMAESDPSLLYVLQLTPELAEEIARYSRVCFVDAHTGKIPEDLRLISVEPKFQQSPFTHHLTAESCLSFCHQLYGTTPEAIIVSVRGFEFGFSQQLSPQTMMLVEQAITRIWTWLQRTVIDRKFGELQNQKVQI